MVFGRKAALCLYFFFTMELKQDLLLFKLKEEEVKVERRGEVQFRHQHLLL